MPSNCGRYWTVPELVTVWLSSIFSAAVVVEEVEEAAAVDHHHLLLVVEGAEEEEEVVIHVGHREADAEEEVTFSQSDWFRKLLIHFSQNTTILRISSALPSTRTLSHAGSLPSAFPVPGRRRRRICSVSSWSRSTSAAVSAHWRRFFRYCMWLSATIVMFIFRYFRRLSCDLFLHFYTGSARPTRAKKWEAKMLFPGGYSSQFQVNSPPAPIEPIRGGAYASGGAQQITTEEKVRLEYWTCISLFTAIESMQQAYLKKIQFAKFS